MKKKYIISILFLLVFSLALFFLIRFSDSTILSTEGYFVDNEAIDKVLLSEKKHANSKNVKLSQVDYNDKFYSNMGNLYVGDKEKKYVNDTYPIISKDGLSVVNINEKSKMISNEFDIYSGYENSTITDGKLFNYNDSAQADFNDYIFLQLKNSTYVNLHDILIDTIVNDYKIPVNSFMVFYEKYIKYYFFDSKGILIYNIIDGLDYSTNITLGENEYDYIDILKAFNIVDIKNEETEVETPEEETVKPDNNSSSSNSGTITEKPFVYVKPKVSVVEDFEPNVYSAKAKIKVSDPSGVIIGGVNFQFYIGEKLFSRRAFVSSGNILVNGLVPDTKFKIIGSYKYYSEDKKKIENTFFEQEITTLSVGALEPIDLYFENGEIYSNKIEIVNFKINSSLKNEAINGISKGVIVINGDEYALSRGVLSNLVLGKKSTYSSPSRIKSNSEVTYEIKLLDAFSNVIKVSNNKGKTRTAKEKPDVSLKRTTDEINSSTFSVKYSNKDDVKVSSFRYVMYDSSMNVKFSGDLDIKDVQEIAFDKLNPSSLYYLKIFADYDLEDGRGLVKNNLLTETKFTTLSLSSLGVIKLNAEIDTLESHSIVIKSSIDKEHTSSLLLSLLNSFSVVVTDENNKEWYRKEFTSEKDFEELFSEEFFLDIKDLYSDYDLYNINFVATAKQGQTEEEIEVDCPLVSFKLLKSEPRINITNFFSTDNMMLFDVEIVDLDDVISEDYVNLRILDEKMMYVDVLKITKNQKPLRLEFENLDYGTSGEFNFKFIAEGYNIGYDSSYFEANKELIPDGLTLKLNKDVFANVQLLSLKKVSESNNYFNIDDSEKFRNTGATSSKSIDSKNNILTIGAKNGIANVSYYVPDVYDEKNQRWKEVNVSFWAKYSDTSVSTRNVYFANNYTDKTTSNQLVGLNKDNYVKYSFTFTASSTYFGFVIKEENGLNQTTYVDIKNLMITDKLTYDNESVSYTEHKFTNSNETTNSKGSAYASIMESGKSSSLKEYTSGINTYTAITTGNHKVVACGAPTESGNGVCTSGTINLKKGDNLHFYVDSNDESSGGYTDVRLIGGEEIDFSNVISQNSRIMFAPEGAGKNSYISGRSGDVATMPLINYVRYKEKEGYKGSFKINLGYKKSEEQTLELDGKYYIRVCNSSMGSCIADGGTLLKEEVINTDYENLFDKNKDISLALSFKDLNGNFYNIDVVTFSTISQIYGISSPKDFSSLHSDGRYVVLNDLDFNDSTGYFSGNFNGDIDFQGYKVIMPVSKQTYIINTLESGATIKNVVVDYDLNVNGKKLYNGIVVVNRGTIENVTININSSNTNVNTIFYESSFISRTNSGIIQNFVVNNNTNIKAYYGVGLVSYDNSGRIKNGYVRGNDIDATTVNDTSHKYGKAVGGLVALNSENGVIRNIYSLISIKSDISIANEAKVGNIVGYNSGNISDSYSVELPIKYTEDNGNPNILTSDPNIGYYSKGIIENVYYSSNKTYSNSKSNKLVKSALYEVTLQKQLLNDENMFYIDRYVNVGCFPQVILNDCMPRQELVFLPILTDEDKITISSNEEIVTEANTAIFKLQLFNTDKQKISAVSIDNINSSVCTTLVDSDIYNFSKEKIKKCSIDPDNLPSGDRVWILDQTDHDGNKSELIVQIYKKVDGRVPTDFKSTLTINDIVGTLSGTNVNYTIEKKVDIPLYYPINNKTEWKLLNTYPSGNFMLMTDLDFSSTDKSDACLNLNRDKYCCKSSSGECLIKFRTSNSPGCVENDSCYESISSYIIKNTFTGKLDGNNHVLSNIRIKRSETFNSMFAKLSGATVKNLYVDNFQKVNMDVSASKALNGGFFEVTVNSSVIDNVHLRDVDMYGDRYAGALVARVESKTTISNSSATNVRFYYNPSAGYFLKEQGGLVGYANGLTIQNSYVSNLNLDISLKGLSTAGVGGLVGTLNNGSIENAYASGVIKNNGSITGGIVGRLFNNASINNVWSDVDIYSNMDYVGGIVGRRENTKISNTLVIGEVLSSYKCNTVNRTIGNTLSVGMNNYAWEGQKFDGMITSDLSVEELVNFDSLNSIDFYKNKLGLYDNDFSFDNLSNNQLKATLPLIRHSKTGIVLNSNKSGFEQESRVLEYDELTVSSVDVDVELVEKADVGITINPAESNIKISFNDSQNIITKENIKEIKFDYIVPSTNGYNIDVGIINNDPTKKNLVINNFDFTAAFDSYILEKIVLKSGTVLDLNIKIDYIYYNYINSSEDWYKYFLYANSATNKAETGENFMINPALTRLEVPQNNPDTLDLCDPSRTDYNFVAYLDIGRLEYRGQGEDNSGRVVLDFGGTKFEKCVTLFNSIARSLKNVQFENVNFAMPNSTSNYRGFIAMVYGTVDNIVFKNFRLSAPKALIVAPISGWFGESLSNVRMESGTWGDKTKSTSAQAYYSNQIVGNYYVGGIIAYKYSFSDVTNVTIDDSYVESKNYYYTGGIIGNIEYGESNVFNVHVNNCKIKGRDYVGGAIGYGSADGYVASSGETKYSTVRNTIVEGRTNYVGGFSGQTQESLAYVKVENVTINKESIGSYKSSSVGGVAGYAHTISNSIVDNVEIYGGTNVGGLSGVTRDGYSVRGSSVSNTEIYPYGVNAGGAVGKFIGTGTVSSTSVVNTKIDDSKATAGAVSYVGGIIGLAESGGKVSNVLANVDIITSGYSVGGIFGRISVIHTTNSKTSAAYDAILADSTITVRGENAVSSIGLFTGSSTSTYFPGKFSRILLDGKIVKRHNTTSTGYITGSYTTNIGQTIDVFITDTSKILTIPEGNTSGDESQYTEDKLIDANFGSIYTVHIVPKNDLLKTNFYTKNSYTSSTGSTLRGMASSSFIVSWLSGLASTGVVDGKFPKVNYLMPEVAIPNASLAYNFKSLSSAMHELPDIKVYSSDVDKINIDFSDVDKISYFEIYVNDKKIASSDILKRTYTISYDYQSDLKIYMSDELSNKTITFKPEDLLNKTSVYGSKYAYIYDGELLGNFKSPKEKFIHIYEDKALNEKGAIFDITKEGYISSDSEIKSELLAENKPLYSFAYDDVKIDTYGLYSIIHRLYGDVYFENQVFVKDGTLEIVDSSLDVVNNSVIVDEYSKKNYATVLGNDGTIYNLKNEIKLPRSFDNSKIAYMSNNINSKNSMVVVMYENGKVVIFDYRTGKLVTSKRATSDISIIDYFKENFEVRSSSISDDLSNDYEESLKLLSTIEANPIIESDDKYIIEDKKQDKDDKTSSGSNKVERNTYVSYYNNKKGTYDVLDVSELIDKNKDEKIVVENDKIYSSSNLVEFYNNKSMFEKIFGNVNILLMVVIILLGILGLLVLYFANIKRLKESNV